MQSGAEANALKKIQKYWKRSHDVQEKRNTIYQRIWQRYKSYNPDVSDPYRSNLVMPTVYSAAETVAPRITKAIVGKRPYIPIKSEKNPDAVKTIETALDTYLYWANFKTVVGQTVKAIFNFGTAFWEPIPYKKLISERQIMPSPEYPWQPVMVETKVPRFRLDIRSYMPWQVYPEPHMVNLKSPGYVIIIEIVPVSEIERLVDSGRYPNVDKEKLRSSGEKEDILFSEQMLKALNITRPDDDSDYGVLMRFQENDEYITAWNGTLLLADEDNPYNHDEINVIKCAWNLDPMLQNSFWGQPDIKAAESLIDKYDESLNQIFENGSLATQAVMGFKEGAVNENQLIWVGGARIPVKNNFDRPIREAIDVFEGRGLPPDAYKLPSFMKQEIDRALGVHDPDYGDPSEGDQTATEMSLLASRGDLRNENRTEMIEAMSLSDLADKCTSHMDQFMSFDDLAEVVGMEMATQVATMNPYMVPGGFDYQFKGSDSYINDYQKRADLRAVMEILQNNPMVKPDGLARKALEAYGWNEQEINEVVRNPMEIQMAMQQQEEEQDKQMVKELQADAVRAEIGAKFKGRESAPKAKQKPDTKKQKAAQVPTQGNTAGGRA